MTSISGQFQGILNPKPHANARLLYPPTGLCCHLAQFTQKFTAEFRQRIPGTDFEAR